MDTYIFFLDVHLTTAIYMVLNSFFFFTCLLHWMGQRNLRYFISQLFRIPPFSCLGPILSRVGFRIPPLPTLPKKKNHIDLQVNKSFTLGVSNWKTRKECQIRISNCIIFYTLKHYWNYLVTSIDSLKRYIIKYII